MLRHNHVSDYRKAIAAANLLQDLKKQVSILLFAEQRAPLVTACGDEVQVSVAVIAMQPLGHWRCLPRTAKFSL